MNDKDIARFWTKVDKRGPDECWEWKTSLSHEGYGQFYVSVPVRKNLRAHRVAFLIHHGRWPAECCCHACDNRRCCNPSHLFDGTHADNARDRVVKGRSGGNFSYFGERHWKSVLTSSDVEKAMSLRGALNNRAIGAMFGVSKEAIKAVFAGRTWTRVTGLSRAGIR